MLKTLRDPSEKVLAWLLLTPAFLLIALIVIYPVGKLIYNSFFDLRLSGGANLGQFVGWLNYQDVLKDADFWHATQNTLWITLITVPGALLVGLGLALLANLPFQRKWPVRLALLLPWALPLSFCGLILPGSSTPTTASSTMCCAAWASKKPPCGCFDRTGLLRPFA